MLEFSRFRLWDGLIRYSIRQLPRRRRGEKGEEVVGKSLLAMERIRGFLVRRKNAAKEKTVQSSRPPVIEEHLDHQPQTPPVPIAPEPRHPRKRRTEQTPPVPFNPFDDHDIPRPAKRATGDPNMMLALAVPIVRPVDVNVYRKPGHMGINPTTLTGLTGPLPGAFGEGKEYTNSMPCHRPQNRPEPREPKTRQIDATVERVRQQSSEDLMFGMTKFRMQYLQAVLDGDAIDDSSVDTNHERADLSRFPEPAPQETAQNAAGDDGDADWVDTSDDEDASERETEPEIIRKDSGYASGDALSISNKERACQRLVWHTGRSLKLTKKD